MAWLYEAWLSLAPSETKARDTLGSYLWVILHDANEPNVSLISPYCLMRLTPLWPCGDKALFTQGLVSLPFPLAPGFPDAHSHLLPGQRGHHPFSEDV